MVQFAEVSNPRVALAEALGIAKVCVVPEDEIAKLVPDALTAKVCVAFVRPLSEVLAHVNAPLPLFLSTCPDVPCTEGRVYSIPLKRTLVMVSASMNWFAAVFAIGTPDVPLPRRIEFEKPPVLV